MGQHTLDMEHHTLDTAQMLIEDGLTGKAQHQYTHVGGKKKKKSKGRRSQTSNDLQTLHEAFDTVCTQPGSDASAREVSAPTSPMAMEDAYTNRLCSSAERVPAVKQRSARATITVPGEKIGPSMTLTRPGSRLQDLGIDLYQTGDFSKFDSMNSRIGDPSGIPMDAGSSCSPRGLSPQTAGTLKGFKAYVNAEMDVNIQVPKIDSVYRQTARDTLYNSLFKVAPHLERYMLFGVLLCLDCFLAVLTLVPLRGAKAIHSFCSRRTVTPEHVFNIAMLLVWTMSCLVLINVQAGAIYFWMKDITPEFLKIHALYGALDIFEKVLANFGIDSVTSIAGTCGMMFHSSKPSKVAKRTVQLMSDMVIAWITMTLHGIVIMCQALIYAVALNGSKNALLALLIASQFMEVKGIVYKKFDGDKLYSMALLDLTERFHLALALAFVAIEDMLSSGTFVPDKELLYESGRILACEVLLDTVKHTSLAKFNNIRPGMYREFFRSLTDKLVECQSHTANTLVSVEPYGMAALAMRQLFMLLMLKARLLMAVLTEDGSRDMEDLHVLDYFVVRTVRGLSLGDGEWTRLVTCGGIIVTWGAVLWGCMTALKMMLGYCLRLWAQRYNVYYNEHHGSKFFRAKGT